MKNRPNKSKAQSTTVTVTAAGNDEDANNTENDESIARALAEQEAQAVQSKKPSSRQVFKYPGDIRRKKQNQADSATTAAATVTCPGGCGPLEVRIVTSKVICNACNRVMKNDELDHACPMCDYHECEVCKVKRQQQQQQRQRRPNKGREVVRGRKVSPADSPSTTTIPGSYVPAPQAILGARQWTPMCQIPCVVGPNSVCVEMMIDTGAQSSVISAMLAKRLGIYNLMDKSQQGIASGVGRARILGRIQNALVTLGHVEFHMEFMVLDVPESLLLLGLDQMRKYKCIVDLEREVLIFGGAGGVEVPMLPPDEQHEVYVSGAGGDGCSIS
eukprot:scaffold1106_cov126-Cylindrotheca_fusiformis.AAC.2